MKTVIRTGASVLALAAGMMTAGIALAEPRDAVTETNLPSDIPNGFGSAAVATTGTYTVRFVRVQGSLTKVTTSNTFASEALIELFPQSGTETRQVLSTSPIAGFTGTIPIDTFLRLSRPLSVAPGFLNFSTFDAYEDGAGVESQWDTLTLTLNDGPPGAVDIGQLSNGTIRYTGSVASGQTKWVRLSIPGDVNAGLSRSLVVNTLGTTLAPDNDPVIGLYNEEGIRVGYNDDAPGGGLGLQSQISYGSGGVDGNLPAGTYYLGIRGLGGSNGVGWDFRVTGASSPAGAFFLNITQNFGTPAFCPADFNKSGIVSVQDVFDFLAAFFGSCP